MDALDCPVCRLRRVAPGAAACSLACGAVLMAAQRRLRLVPPLAEVPGNQPELDERQVERSDAA